MDTSKIAGIRWVDSSIVVITISSSELSIQGSNMYFFFCCRYLSAVSDDREPSTSYIAHRKKLRKRYGEKKANGLITIYLVFYFHIIIVAAKCVYSTQTKYKIQNTFTYTKYIFTAKILELNYMIKYERAYQLKVHCMPQGTYVHRIQY